MKRTIIYLITSLLLTLPSGCGKHSVPEVDQVPGAYIFFSQIVDTKASLVEDKAGLEFGVVGYKYDKGRTWATAGTLTPNVFYDGNDIVPVETVTCDAGGNGSYEPLQGWTNTKKYSFFAYYPLGNDYVTLVNTGGNAYTGGVPAIKYTMDTSSDAAFKASMVDVMTAPCHKDLYGYSSIGSDPTSGDIRFDFSHRLSALAVNVKNSSTCGITLNSLTLNISGIKYYSLVIPLDGAAATSIGPTAAFSKSLGLTIASGEASVTSTGAELSDKLLFIPQSENISINIVLNYTRKLAGYAEYTESIPLDARTTILEGKKHIIQLNFKDSTVEVSSTATTGWTTVPPVTDTFN